MKECEIIQGCKQNNRLAQKLFVEQYSKYMYAICRRYINDSELAKDCLQESLVQVLKSIDKYTEQGKFKGWIASITVRKCINQLRIEKRHISSDLDMVAEPSVNDNTLYKLEHEDVMKFIETLPERYRVVINMFLVEGYSHKEIGIHLGINESSSRSLLTRGRKMIMEQFSNENMQIVHKARLKKKLINQ